MSGCTVCHGGGESNAPHTAECEEVNRVAKLLIAEWERVEHVKPNPPLVATLVDLARAVIADRAEPPCSCTYEAGDSECERHPTCSFCARPSAGVGELCGHAECWASVTKASTR